MEVARDRSLDPAQASGIAWSRQFTTLPLHLTSTGVLSGLYQLGSLRRLNRTVRPIRI